MKTTPVLTAKTREKLGSRYSKRLRDGGGLPAIVYGHGEAPAPIVLDAREALDHFHKGEKVFKLSFDGKATEQVVLLKDVQFDYLGTNVVHADLARVDLNQRVKVRVPIHLVGESKGLKTAGAILMHPLNELEIECMVTELPDHIDVEITDLDVGHAITAGDVKLPSASMKLLSDHHANVAQIVIQQEIKADEAATVAGGGA
jgi:large subunit ribosomal protein L25